jgi:cell division protease FtsH
LAPVVSGALVILAPIGVGLQVTCVARSRWTRQLRRVRIEPVSDRLPSTGEFGAAFIAFMRAMQAAADAPDPPWVTRLREHLGTEPAELAVTAATFREADRPNLQLALDAVLPERELIGLPAHIGGGFSSLLGPKPAVAFISGRGASARYLDVELGDGRVVHCIANALLLVEFDDAPVALVISDGDDGRGPRMMGPMGPVSDLRLEGISPDSEAASRLFAAIRAAMLEHNVFRGRIISINGGGGVTFPAVTAVARDSIVLPDGALERLEQHALGISAHADELRAAGRHLKRGVLLHGPPGTGKTLSVNYLLTQTAGRTTVLLSGPALGHLASAFAIARDLQPATVVLEDVDLVAAERTMPWGGGEILFQLLNELEGLAEDTDLLVVLTTNRPDVVEPALAARPGRIDLALEIPLPDATGRRRLLQLYAREITLSEDAIEQLVTTTEGVTGAFVKELMRQATLRAASAEAPPTADDVLAIADDLLNERAKLTRSLLGHGGDDGSEPAHLPAAMLSAVRAAGLPLPPNIGRHRE